MSEASMSEASMSEASMSEASMSERRRKYLRIFGLIVLVGGLWFIGSRPRVRGYFAVDHLRELIAQSGGVGLASYVGIYIAGYLIQIPAMLFVVTAAIAWGPWIGAVVAFLGSMVAATINFWVLRTVGGAPLADIESGWVQNLLAHLDDHPLRTVIILRTLLFLNPMMNTPLVLSGVGFRDYIIGSAIGIVVPIAVVVAALDTVLAFLGLG